MDYMQELSDRDGFRTLKTQYKQGCSNFPALGQQSKGPIQIEIGELRNVESEDREEMEELERIRYEKREMERRMQELGGEVEGLENQRDIVMREIEDLKTQGPSLENELVEADLREGLGLAFQMAVNIIIEQVTQGSNTAEAVKLLAGSVDLNEFNIVEGKLTAPQDYLKTIESAVLPKFKKSYEKLKENIEEQILTRLKKPEIMRSNRYKRKNLVRTPPDEIRKSKSTKNSELSDTEFDPLSLN